MAKNKIPKTVKDTIPFVIAHENGVLESEGGLFSKAYSLEDINFTIAPNEEQRHIFLNFEKFLNTFSERNPFQIVIHNFRADKASTLKTIKFSPQRDGLNKYRQEYNSILFDKISTGNNSLKQNKYLIVTHYDNDEENALKALRNIDKDVQRAIQCVLPDKEVRYIETEKRLETLYHIYHKGNGTFGNAIDENGNSYLDYEAMYKQGLDVKDFVAPSSFLFKDNFLKVGDSYARVFFIEKIPTYLSTDYLADLANINAEMLISIHYQPLEQAKVLKMIKGRITGLNAQISDRQSKASKGGYSTDLISPDLTAQKKSTQDLLHDVVSRDQKMIAITFVVTAFADTKEELVEISRQIDNISQGTYQAPLRTLIFQQEDGFNASLPLGVNKIDPRMRRNLTTESVAIFMPYTSQELHQSNGIFYGRNQVSNNLIVYDRMHPKAHNFNGLIFGDSGSGKSYAAKNEMVSALLRSNKNKVYIIDPQSEYHKMADAFNGEIVELSANSKTFINPLDMDLNYGDDDDPVAIKSEYIMGMIEIMMGKDKELTAKEKSILDRCVKEIYRGYIEHMEAMAKRHYEAHRPGNPPTCDKSATPTIANLYSCLLEQPEEEAHNLASTIEIYTQGSLSTFAHRSNVNTTKNLVVYDIKNLGKGLKPLGLHISLNDIWNKMFENFANGYNTWIYIDEFYLLLKNDAAASFLMQIWKTARKWRGIPTGIMQNTGDLLNSDTTRDILNLTNFVILMSLQKMDRNNISDLMQIPASQLTYVTNAQKGHGLLYTGDVVIPFENEYPKDTELYKLMNTTEKIGE